VLVGSVIGPSVCVNRNHHADGLVGNVRPLGSMMPQRGGARPESALMPVIEDHRCKKGYAGNRGCAS
jgi:hypothetical protein